MNQQLFNNNSTTTRKKFLCTHQQPPPTAQPWRFLSRRFFFFSGSVHKRASGHNHLKQEINQSFFVVWKVVLLVLFFLYLSVYKRFCLFSVVCHIFLQFGSHVIAILVVIFITHLFLFFSLDKWNKFSCRVDITIIIALVHSLSFGRLFCLSCSFFIFPFINAFVCSLLFAIYSCNSGHMSLPFLLLFLLLTCFCFFL